MRDCAVLFVFVWDDMHLLSFKWIVVIFVVEVSLLAEGRVCLEDRG